MDRRELLRLALAAPILNLTPNLLGATEVQQFGWIPNVRRSLIPSFSQRSPRTVKGSGAGRRVRLSSFLQRATGKSIVPHHQQLGDCIGHSFGLAVDTLAATRIFLRGHAEQFKAKTSTEVLYAGSRYEIGYQKHGITSALRGEGSVGSWCAEFIRDYGTLLRGKYNPYDLTQYNAQLAKQWGKTGVPDGLESLIKQHPVRSYSLCTNYEECRDAIANGYPVIFCSGVGFNSCRKHNPNGRDKQGFLVPCGKWFHAMAALDVDDKSARKSITLYQSWGPDWLNGAYTEVEGLPKWAFKIDVDTVNKMCDFGDTIAISNYLGHPGQPQLDYVLF